MEINWFWVFIVCSVVDLFTYVWLGRKFIRLERAYDTVVAERDRLFDAVDQQTDFPAGEFYFGAKNE